MTKDVGRSATLLLGKVEMEDSSGLSTRYCQTVKKIVASDERDDGNDIVECLTVLDANLKRKERPKEYASLLVENRQKEDPAGQKRSEQFVASLSEERICDEGRLFSKENDVHSLNPVPSGPSKKTRNSCFSLPIPTPSKQSNKQLSIPCSSLTPKGRKESWPSFHKTCVTLLHAMRPSFDHLISSNKVVIQIVYSHPPTRRL
ncbi:hypothetical protein BLNAU_5464 [Blattamonas nauphoetae]|uniref:Uncharacterized protein n=1 Tax=Blattamonas nauphoetae TaxID=2049346 RepID=A0ABQ9Y7F1_9EUKA|nr:hypothetical protein BLNAU_5464 [Blattamonas nauphoetae]